MLLSLGAGGVGLNLVGANHLFLLDCHWNPQVSVGEFGGFFWILLKLLFLQLEAQACDRIYRVGQKREVYIHRSEGCCHNILC